MMPRFTIRTLLILIAFVALWLSTFFVMVQPTNPVGIHVRSIMVLLVFLSATCSAIYFKGQSRAFWGGFAAMMLMLTLNLPTKPPYILEGDISSIALAIITPFFHGRIPDQVAYCLRVTVYLGVLLSLSCLMGFISTCIYDKAGKEK